MRASGVCYVTTEYYNAWNQVAVSRSTRSTIRCLVVATATLGVLVVTPTPVVGQQIVAQDVQEAIQKGVDYLLARQRPDGSWSEWLVQPGGVSALATLALLNAGVDPDQPAIQRPLAKIRSAIPTHTYVVALQTRVLCRTKSEDDLATIRNRVRWLETKQIAAGPRRGAWSYPTGIGDNSNTDFALDALYEAERAGVAVNAATWRLAKQYLESSQNQDGSWGYHLGNPGTGSMTTAGTASLILSDDRVSALYARIEGDQAISLYDSHSANDRIQRARVWIDRNFSITSNPGSPRPLWHYYYLYCLERFGRVAGQPLIGGRDWYREGADYLVRHQDKRSGCWEGLTPVEDMPEITTSLALLFLCNGRRPVIVAKLRYGEGDDWNRHRHDAGNLTHCVGTRWKRDLNWQIVDLESASVDDMARVPLLWLNGFQSPWPASSVDQDVRAAKIRGYVERGGVLLAEPCSGSTEFDSGFRRLMRKAFPEPEHLLRALSPDHPIWSGEERVAAGDMWPLQGIEFKGRTKVVYAPRDRDSRQPSLSWLWELSGCGFETPSSDAVNAQLRAGLAIGANLLVYATNREFRGREFFFKSSETAATGSEQPKAIGTIVPEKN